MESALYRNSGPVSWFLNLLLPPSAGLPGYHFPKKSIFSKTLQDARRIGMDPARRTCLHDCKVGWQSAWHFEKYLPF